jgi:hypothetical protein
MNKKRLMLLILLLLLAGVESIYATTEPVFRTLKIDKYA